MNKIYEKLRAVLRGKIEKHHLAGHKLTVRCKILSPEEAIGDPEDRDYPIIKGKEHMVEAFFEGARGQAFSDDFAEANYQVEELLELQFDSNRKRADFIAGFNAVFRHLGLCDASVHCRDEEPRECAKELVKKIGSGKKILLVGLQPRFLEFLTSANDVRVVDLDRDNIGKEKFGVIIEGSEKTDEAIQWCELIFATGSTIVNDTINDLLDRGKPVLFYGVTLAAPAKILNLDTFCFCGH